MTTTMTITTPDGTRTRYLLPEAVARVNMAGVTGWDTDDRDAAIVAAKKTAGVPDDWFSQDAPAWMVQCQDGDPHEDDAGLPEVDLRGSDAERR